MKKILIITGGSGTGKTTLAKAIAKKLGSISLLSQDDYYREVEVTGNVDDYDFDRPELIEWDRLYGHIQDLMNDCEVLSPVYQKFNSGEGKNKVVLPSDLIVVEGVFLLSQKIIQDLGAFCVFLELNEEKQLERRLHRDIHERKFSKDSIILRWNRFVKPAHKTYVEPAREKCHIRLEEEDPALMADKVIKALYK